MLKRVLWGSALAMYLVGIGWAQGIEMRIMSCCGQGVVWLANNTGQPVSALRIAFDQHVRLLGKLEFGGLFVDVTGAKEGTDFSFVGNLVPAGVVELRWQPIEAVPVLVVWAREGRVVGKPYFATLDVLFAFLAEGVVRVREASPETFAEAIKAWFTVNAQLETIVEGLGFAAEEVIALLSQATVEELVNLFRTLAEMLGLSSVESFWSAFDWTPVFNVLIL